MTHHQAMRQKMLLERAQRALDMLKAYDEPMYTKAGTPTKYHVVVSQLECSLFHYED